MYTWCYCAAVATHQSCGKTEQSQQGSSRGEGLVDASLVPTSISPHLHILAHYEVSELIRNDWLLLPACCYVMAARESSERMQ